MEICACSASGLVESQVDNGCLWRAHAVEGKKHNGQMAAFLMVFGRLASTMTKASPFDIMDGDMMDGDKIDRDMMEI